MQEKTNKTFTQAGTSRHGKCIAPTGVAKQQHNYAVTTNNLNRSFVHTLRCDALVKTLLVFYYSAAPQRAAYT